jgi:hypothetical protein
MSRQLRQTQQKRSLLSLQVLSRSQRRSLLSLQVLLKSLRWKKRRMTSLRQMIPLQQISTFHHRIIYFSGVLFWEIFNLFNLKN